MANDEITVWRVTAHHKEPKVAARWIESANIIAIGWGKIGDVRKFKSAPEIADAVHGHYPARKDWNRGGKSLFDLCHRMKIGDLVIVSCKGRGRILVMEVEGDYVFKPEVELQPIGDYQHQRKGKLVLIDPDMLWKVSGGFNGDRFLPLIRCRESIDSETKNRLISQGGKAIPRPNARRENNAPKEGSTVEVATSVARSSIILPPIPNAETFLKRIQSIIGLPERNHEDIVKEFLIRNGFDDASIIFQLGRIDLCIIGSNRKAFAVFEVKCNIAIKTEKTDALRKGIDYANQTGALIVVLTDGDRYEIYDRRRGHDYDSMICGKFQLTAFREADVSILQLLQPKNLLPT